MQNIAIIRQGTGRYLFCLPDNVTLKEGDRVKCSTKRGITDGVAFADSVWVDENVSQLIGKLTGAKFPLKSVAGKMEYHPFEKPEDKPANKYEGMSNSELDREMCVKKGMCLATNSGSRRKRDCPFAGKCNSRLVTDSDRAEVIKYLLAEDAGAAPKPEEKSEPIKLYCVKDYITPHGNVELIKGAVCAFNPAVGALELPDGRLIGDATEPRSYDGWKAENPFRADCLVPLVKRPAKVGEWVLLDRDDCVGKNKKGDVVKVVSAPSNTTTFCFISDPTRKYSGGICVCFGSDYTYVLDGYKPEPEAELEPEHFSGKVVCVSSGDECFTVGKMYEFVNGKVKDDVGDVRPMLASQRFKSVDEWNEFFGSPIARFIEFKGEAHD